MFRQTSRRVLSVRLPPRHMYSTQHPHRAPRQPRIITAITALAFVVSGVYLLSGKSEAESPAGPVVNQIPFIKQVKSQDEIPVISPVKALSFKEAEEKLRKVAQTFVFESKDGETGRIDLVSLSSNCPIEDAWSIGIGRGVGGNRTIYAGVYDGHAGWATSTVLREALIPYVSTSLGKLLPSDSSHVVDEAIKTAFSQLDDRIMGTAKKIIETHSVASAEGISAVAMASSGSCALMTIYDAKTSILRTAVTGDSRAVLGSWSPKSKSFAAEALSKDQTGFNEAEVERLSKDHPGEKDDILDPKSGRLLGMAITRAFGNHRWKWTSEFIEGCHRNLFNYPCRPKYKTPPYMTAAPEVTTQTVTTDDFVILGSDGLWDHISNEDAVICVSRWLDARRANKPEDGVTSDRAGLVSEDGWTSWKSKPEDFVIEDLDSAAVCLVKNAFGGRRRELFRGVLTAREPASRYVRDDITVQVIFFKDPYQ